MIVVHQQPYLMRLNKFLAHAGVASRRKCDDLISRGFVSINNKICLDYSYKVTNDDCVRVNKEIVNLNNEKIVYVLNKPKGVISTVSDDRNRATVIDFLPKKHRLFPIGRLDRDTTGVLLISNDGELSNKLTHPSYSVEKIYIATTYVNVNKSKLYNVRNGIKLDDGSIAYAKILFIKKLKKKFIWKIFLKEGKKREIKRIFISLGSKIIDLHRESFAGIKIGNLKPGKYRRLKKHEIPKF